MEQTGCLVDFDHLVDLERRLEKEKLEIIDKIVQEKGWSPNLRSPKQMSDFLFNSEEEGGLGLPTDGIEQGVNGAYSTAEKVIRHFGGKNEIVKLILDYRSIEVVDRSFCKKLIKIAQTDGKVRTGFSQTRTVTSRLNSSGKINMQNLPKEKGMIRKAFIAKLKDDSESDLVLCVADQSQFELRVAAHLSKEPTLMAIYNAGETCTCIQYLQGHECDNKNPNIKCGWSGLLSPEKEKKCPKCGSKAKWLERCKDIDVHVRTSEEVGVDRQLAKILNFSLLYRVGPEKFAIQAGLLNSDGSPKKEYAKEIMDKWMSVYWGIPEWQYLEEIRLRQNKWIGYSATGRQRRLDQERKFNEYGAVTQYLNFIVQGLCADILKLGSIKIYNEREKRIANSQPAERKLWKQFKFLVQVHDEVVWQAPKQLIPELGFIRKEMEGVAKLAVPLQFKPKYGNDWETAR